MDMLWEEDHTRFSEYGWNKIYFGLLLDGIVQEFLICIYLSVFVRVFGSVGMK